MSQLPASSSFSTSKESSKKSRRRFLSTTAAAGFGFIIVPRHVLGGPGHVPPSERVNLAGIGAGGMGGGDIATFHRLGANVVALCDVDDARAAGSYNAFPQARRYKDFRVLLDKEAKNVDAVTVGTPDHIHAVASMGAIRAGKHVYCQKPLTHTLYECRQLTKAARAAKVMTSMGNQGHATDGARLTNEWLRAGVIGEVREVHVWSDRAGKLWKQGIGRPTETPAVPSTLDWNLWLGPVRERPYHPAYAPVSWRGWWDFGTGALGDMGCHIIDHPVWALELPAPTSVESRTTLDGTLLDGGKTNFETYPLASIIYYEFPARGKLPPVKMTWYEGGLMPPTPAGMPAGQQLPDNGALYVGSEGTMYHGSHGGMPQLLSATLHEKAKTVAKTMDRSPGHYEEWIAACKGGKAPTAGFDYSGPLTEIVLLGVLSLRAPGRRLIWDSENLKVTNLPELNDFTHIEYRQGF
ncbi:MAG TPA: Gfo/Idh/MocA family oxidoreductase [Pirellulales bacterium]|jgi:predicted dehydrogenase|nr:Gfo/Idh/MocA family oxidoreductase [Pirellulales bacterium]